MKDFLLRLLNLLSFGILGNKPAPKPVSPPESSEPEPEPPQPEPEPLPELEPEPDPEPEPKPAPPRKSIVPLLIYPSESGDTLLDETTEAPAGNYYISSPLELPITPINDAIGAAEDWLADVLGTRIVWTQVRIINSERSLSDWRSRNISLIRDETDILGLPWTDDYIYLAFVRGMGGYAGGIRYRDGSAGYAMVGDVCLQAICNYGTPTAGSVLLGERGWPPNAYSVIGQTGAFIHEALHGLDLPHPDGWPEEQRPD